MTNFIKKQRVGTWISFAVTVLSIVSLIIYSLNCSMEGYFKDMSNGLITILSVSAIIISVAAIVLAQFDVGGTGGAVKGVVIDVFRIAAAAMLIGATLFFLECRVDGFGYIFFSDFDVLAAIQTPENMSSANTAIVGIIFYAISGIAAIAGTFFEASGALDA